MYVLNSSYVIKNVSYLMMGFNFYNCWFFFELKLVLIGLSSFSGKLGWWWIVI